MAVSAKNHKLQKAEGESKTSSPRRPLTSNSSFASKTADLHIRKNKEVELNKTVQNGQFSKGFDVFQPVYSTMENNMVLERNNIHRRGVGSNPSVTKSPKKAVKKYPGDAHGAVGVFVLNGPSTNQILPQNESKPAVKTTPLTQLLNKNQAKAAESSRMLVTVNVSGSTGPLRFLVDAKDHVSRVIELALRAYAREGRLPHLGSSCKSVELYLNNANFEALDPVKPVGSLGTRHFLLHKRKEEESDRLAAKIDHAGSLPWKLMWNMMMNSIICSH